MAGYIIGGLITAFLAVILIRAVRFRPKVQPITSAEHIEFDRQAPIDSLAALIRCRTVSYHDHSLEEDAEFEKLISLLPDLYPNVFKICSFDRLPDRALLFRWPGKSQNHPSVMMAHYDVVPVDGEKWEEAPFSAVIKDGCMWGRGTLDTKGTFNAVLSAANHLIGQEFVPENDVYFAFSGGEEVNGKGADNIVQYFVDHSITPALVVDEGGAVVENVFPGVKVPCGMIGIAEKGMMNVRYSVQSNGGHASAPKPKSPIPVLSEAVSSLEKHPFKMKLNKPAAMMFDTLGRHSTFLYRLVFANMWCFGWIIDLLGRLSGGDINALIRTTVAFTQMEGSSARNVIPTEASVVSNMRLNPEDSVASAREYLVKTVKGPGMSITVLESFEPSRISQTDCPAWDTVASTVAETWPGCIVSPYLMVQCSDSRHYGRISDHVYRFSAMDLTTAERRTIHGNNERIRLETIGKSVEFYIRLMRKC